MDKEFVALLGSLTKEGQVKLMNTVADFIQASDVIDVLYKEACISKEASDDEYRDPLPKASLRYAGGFLAGSALMPWVGGLLEYLSRKRINPALNNVVQQALPAMTSPNTLGLTVSMPGLFGDIAHNNKLKNEDRKKLNELFDKSASDYIDELYKIAKMEVPTPQEAKKEEGSKKKEILEDDRPTIECEECNFKGKTTPKGECPECGTIMGVKPSDYPIPYTPIWTGEPMSGISVNEASIRGRMEEQW